MSSEAVVQKVTRFFVPVAVDRFQIGKSQRADGELWRSVQRQKKAFQGIWIVSPQGKVLSSQSGSSDGKPEPWTQEVLEAIGSALEEFGEVKPRTVTTVDVFSDRGVGDHDGSAGQRRIPSEGSSLTVLEHRQ